MTQEQQRIAIAEACGWTDCHKSLASNQEQEPHERCLIGNPPKGIVHRRLPDYLNDLNACHEMEKVLTTTEQQNRYQSNVAEICWADHDRADNQVVFNQLTATADQRAQAFLRTLGLWTATPTQPQ